ncbi:MAG: 1-phosphofructokinase [bacterium]|nr:1-phosphofructokinase [bacterium]
MIYTVTLNPALDYIMELKDFKLGKTNRSEKEQLRVGGKGINVSVMLSKMGIQSCCLGFVAGFTGAKIREYVNENGLRENFVNIADGMSRINVKLTGLGESEINATGPKITEKEILCLKEKISGIKDGDILVLSGSVPFGVRDTIYAELLQLHKGKNILTVVDAQKDFLVNTLKLKPFLIKPNADELGQIFGVKINGYETAFIYAEKLQQLGARNVIVSLDKLGAVLLDENRKRYIQKAPEGDPVSSVGAGDSLVAGFLYEYIKGSDLEKSLEVAVKIGSATAFSYGLAEKGDIERILAEYEK